MFGIAHIRTYKARLKSYPPQCTSTSLRHNHSGRIQLLEILLPSNSSPLLIPAHLSQIVNLHTRQSVSETYLGLQRLLSGQAPPFCRLSCSLQRHILHHATYFDTIQKVQTRLDLYIPYHLSRLGGRHRLTWSWQLTIKVKSERNYLRLTQRMGLVWLLSDGID